MNILVTGSAGMIGSYVVKGLIEKGHTVIGVDRVKPKEELNGLKPVVLDLTSKDDLMKLFDENKIDRAIHLAALAHTAGMKNLTWDTYYKINVECAENVFEVCAKNNVPVLFISTVDAIGMVKGLIIKASVIPISNYGKSKALAEGRLKDICKVWNIYRFSPVYTPEVKRDIEKRYYLKYPNWAYKIGKGGQFEVLNVTGAVAAMVEWVDKKVDNTIHVIKDPELQNWDLSFYKTMGMGGTPLTHAVEIELADFMKKHGSPAKPSLGYGLSEITSASATELSATTFP